MQEIHGRSARAELSREAWLIPLAKTATFVHRVALTTLRPTRDKA